MSHYGASLVSVLVDFPSPSNHISFSLILSGNLFCVQGFKFNFKHILAQILCPVSLMEMLSSKP